MHTVSKIILLLLVPFGILAQSIHPGIYASGLMIGFDSASGKVTGVYEDASGWNEELKAPHFSCVFYLTGVVKGDSFPVVTYYPGEEERISGVLVRLDERTIRLRLDQDHGGCWNVLALSNEPQQFELNEEHPWRQIRYVISDKAWFYAEQSDSTPQKTYVIRNDFVCAERNEGSWVYCTFYGEVITRGWLRVEELNSD